MGEGSHTITEDTIATKKSSRRAVLRLAIPASAGVAALAAAAATDLIHPSVAFAADGQALVIGQANSGTNNTFLGNNTGSPTGTFAVTDVATSGDLVNASYGVLARSINGFGVVGLAGAAPPSSGTGMPVKATAQFGAGVYGYVNHHDAPFNTSNVGAGVIAQHYGGAGSLYIVPQTYNGTPTQPASANGMVDADTNGVLYNTRYGGWYALSSVVMLGSPTRLLDTRPGQTDAADHPGAPIAANGIYTLKVGGVSYGGQSIPANAKAVLANVFVLGTGGGGNLALFAANLSGTSGVSMTWTGAGTFLGNFSLTTLSPTGYIKIQNQCGSPTNVTFDAVGYII